MDIQKKSVSKLLVTAVVIGVVAAAPAMALDAPTFDDQITDIGTLLGAMVGFAALAWASAKVLRFI